MAERSTAKDQWYIYVILSLIASQVDDIPP